MELNECKIRPTPEPESTGKPHDGAFSDASARAYLAAATMVVAGAYGMCRFGLGLTLPRISESIAISATLSGVASGLAFLTYCVCTPVAGWFTRSGVPHRATALAAVAALLGSVILAASTSAVGFVIGVAIAGAAAGFVSPAVAYGIARFAPSRQAHRWQAVANAGTGFGVALAGIAALMVSWRLSWLLFGGLTALCAVIVTQLLRRPGGAARESTGRETPGSPKSLVVPSLLAGAIGFGSAIFWTFGRSHAEAQAGLGGTQSLVFWCLVGIAGVGGALSGDLVTRFGFRRTWASVGCCTGVAIVVGGYGTSFAVLLVVAAVFGGGYVLLCGAQITAAAMAWPNAIGAATSVTFTAIAGGQALGSASAGWVTAVLGANVAFAIGGAVCVAGGLGIYLTGFGRQHTSAELSRRGL